MKLIANSFKKRKTEQNNYLKFKPKQYPKPDQLVEIDQNPQRNKPTYASILQKTRKENLRSNFSKTTSEKSRL